MSDQKPAAPTSMHWTHFAPRYLAWVVLLNLAWELAQMPLYALWQDGTAQQIAFAVVHCTGGDALIAMACLLASRLVFGSHAWPGARYLPVAIGTMLFGLGYTVYSEWHNTVVTRSWAYAAAMPQLFGIGLSPVAQWIAIPGFTLWHLSPRQAPLPSAP